MNPPHGLTWDAGGCETAEARQAPTTRSNFLQPANVMMTGAMRDERAPIGYYYEPALTGRTG